MLLAQIQINMDKLGYKVTIHKAYGETIIAPGLKEQEVLKVIKQNLNLEPNSATERTILEGFTVKDM